LPQNELLQISFFEGIKRNILSVRILALSYKDNGIVLTSTIEVGRGPDRYVGLLITRRQAVSGMRASETVSP
jgi:hypothetical protein